MISTIFYFIGWILLIHAGYSAWERKPQTLISDQAFLKAVGKSEAIPLEITVEAIASLLICIISISFLKELKQVQIDPTNHKRSIDELGRFPSFKSHENRAKYLVQDINEL